MANTNAVASIEKRRTYSVPGTPYARRTMYLRVNLNNCNLHLARRCLHGHLLIFALAQHRSTQRRLIRNLALAWLGFGTADDHPGFLVVLAIDSNRHSGADSNFIPVTILFIDDLGARKDAFDLANAPFQMRL